MVISTPAMLSKADLTVADLCLIDLDGNQLAGRPAGALERDRPASGSRSGGPR